MQSWFSVILFLLLVIGKLLIFSSAMLWLEIWIFNWLSDPLNNSTEESLHLYIDVSYEEKHCSRSWTKTSTAQNLGRRKARLGRKKRFSCASLCPRYASWASFHNGLSCAFLRTGRWYIQGRWESYCILTNYCTKPFKARCGN